MENCLVKKLKGIVDNDNLKKFGILTLNIAEADSGGNRLVISGQVTGKARIVGNGHFTNTGSTFDPSGNIGTEVNIPFEGWSTNGNYKIEIDDKYNISGLFNSGNSQSLDLHDLMYNTAFTRITINHCEGDIISFINKNPLLTMVNCSNTENPSKLYGNLVDLKSDNITNLNLSYSGITGNLDDFKSVNITKLDLSYSGITGAIERHAERVYNNIPDGGNYVISVPRTVTLNSMPVSSNSFTAYIKKNGSILTLTSSSGTTTFATYDGENWTY
jgi:hypothetical protein